MLRLCSLLLCAVLMSGCTSMSLDECRTQYAAALTADVITTHEAVSRGYKEGNPILSKSNPAQSAFLTGLIVPALAETFNLLGKPEWAKVFYVTGSYIRGAGALWNVGQMTLKNPPSKEVKK